MRKHRKAVLVLAEAAGYKRLQSIVLQRTARILMVAQCFMIPCGRKKSSWTIPPEVSAAMQGEDDEASGEDMAAESDESPAADGDGIENDWQESVDESSGRSYWYSHKRKKSSWTIPPQGVEGAAAADADEENDWVEANDPDTGYRYEGAAAAEADEENDWVEASDPDTGDRYWYSHTRKKSTWTKPELELSGTCSGTSYPPGHPGNV